jgi:hypothetical protein
MTARRSYTRHGLNAPMARIKLAGFSAIDRRTAAAREHLALRRELANSLGGEAHLPPQQRKRIDLAARASLLLDHVDAWIFQQPRLVNARAKTLLPVLVQRQAIADHLTRLLDKLGLDRVSQKVGPTSAVVILPDNGRDPLLRRTTNGQHPAHPEIGTVKILPRDADEFMSPNEDRHDDDNDDIERELGLR